MRTLALSLAALTVGTLAASEAPTIVTSGRPNVRACAECHLATGFGRPDSSSLAGLPAPYLEQQIADFRRGLRQSGEPDAATHVRSMASIATALSHEDLHAAAAYFASTRYRPWVRVVERDGATGIVEVPAGTTGGYVAYVPPGSIAHGRVLVETGSGGHTVRCALCHGDDLNGLGPVPALAGRSPTYAVRQLRDMKQETRHGLGADLMRATVARLSTDDMVAIAAYLASRRP